MKKAEKILLRAPNWVGDAILAIPAMKSIRAKYPGAEITVLARPWVGGVFTSAPFVDKVWAEPQPSRLKEWMTLARNIRQKQFDIAVLFPNSFESAMMIFLGRVPHRVGYATDGRRWLLTQPVKRTPGKRHQIYYYLELAKALSADTERHNTEITATAEDRIQARKLLASANVPEGCPFLILNPGAAYGSAKRWGEDRFAECADLMSADLGMHVVIVGSEKERSIAEQVAARMTRPVAILNGRTSLETLIGVISECALMVTNDSGPMHLAAALGIPTVAVFGATDDAVTGPRGPKTRIVREPVECSPCMLRDCPIDHRCMTRVTAEAVCRAARELMDE